MPRTPSLALATLALAIGLPHAALASREDPFESFNRKSFAFSLRLDRYIVGPLAKVSTGLIPAPLGRVIHNIIVNLSEPQAIVNDVLQLRAERAVKDTTRLAVNTTFGLLGAIDVAGGAGIRHEPNGFGDTLGRYGVKTGPYLFVPVLGPSDFRDLVGSAVDQISSPMVWVKFPYRTPITISLGLAGGLEQRAGAGPQLQALLSGAADPYATLRSTYLQARAAEVRGETALPPLPDIVGPGELAPSTDTANSPGPSPAAPDLSPAPAQAPAPRAPAPSGPSGPAGPAPEPPPSPATP